jgi:TatD DNase family protein
MLALDLHAHIKSDIDPRELALLEACVVAVTRTPAEFARVAGRHEDNVAWGLGAHPGVPAAHQEFDATRFRDLVNRAAIVGEIGLDGRSKVALEVQRRTFGAILNILADEPRLASVHSSGACELVLDAIEACRPRGVVLHWWRGTEAETQRGLALDCYFSINAAEMIGPNTLDLLPRDRVLTETDHPYGDRAEGTRRRPGRVQTVEAALAERWSLDVYGVRRQVWANFLRLSTETGTSERFPPAFQRTMLAA